MPATRRRKTHRSFVWDFHIGSIRWRDVALRESWWLGMQTICDGVLILHGYEKPDMPLPKGISALDCATGNLLWENDAVMFLFAFGGNVFVRRADFRVTTHLALSLQTGDVVRDYGASEDDIASLSALAESERHAESYVFPEYIQHYGQEVRAAIEKNINVSRVRGGIDAAEWNGLAIASWHEPARGAKRGIKQPCRQHAERH